MLGIIQVSRSKSGNTTGRSLDFSSSVCLWGRGGGGGGGGEESGVEWNLRKRTPLSDKGCFEVPYLEVLLYIIRHSCDGSAPQHYTLQAVHSDNNYYTGNAVAGDYQ